MVTRLLALFGLLLASWGLVALPVAAQVPTDDGTGSEEPTQEQSSEPSEDEGPPRGENHFVEVRDDGFLPAGLEVTLNDVVTFVWVGENPHSATAAPDETNERAFDSHPDCPGPLGGGCGTQGYTLEYHATEVGIIRYSSRHPDDAETHADASITVTAPAPPQPDPDPDPEPSETTEPEPEPDPEPSDGEPSGEPTPDPTGTATATESATPTTSPTPQRGSVPAFSQNSRPVRPNGPVQAPQVAGSATPTASPRPGPSTTPTFDAFPDAADPDDEEEPDEVVIAAPAGDGPEGRLVWSLLGSSLVAMTFGAFGRVVLFGETWA